MSDFMKDPVCGMEVSDGRIKSVYKGKTIYFCSESCKKEFDRNPGKFVK